jgi:hypothetical protein
MGKKFVGRPLAMNRQPRSYTSYVGREDATRVIRVEHRRRLCFIIRARIFGSPESHHSCREAATRALSGEPSRTGRSPFLHPLLAILCRAIERIVSRKRCLATNRCVFEQIFLDSHILLRVA